MVFSWPQFSTNGLASSAVSSLLPRRLARLQLQRELHLISSFSPLLVGGFAEEAGASSLLTLSAGLGAFFTFMTVTEGGDRKAITKKFQDVYIPTLKANYLVWPAVQMINFRLMPIQFQIVSMEDIRSKYTSQLIIFIQPFVSTIGIAWTAYLSLTNSSDES